MGQVNVRDARPEEHPLLHALVMSAYAEYNEFVSAEFVESFAQDLTSLMDDPGTEVIVAEVDGGMAGTVVFYPDGRDYAEAVPSNFGALRALAVSPDRQRAGVGRALMAECLNRARDLGRTRMVLHTLSFMPKAIALHEATGYRRAPEFDMAYTPEVTVLGFVQEL